ncbi:hypothetical protein ACFQZ4_44755 [Catellatospora coxensis]
MTRFLRWLSVSALALLATVVLLPQPASAAGNLFCGTDCLAKPSTRSAGRRSGAPSRSRCRAHPPGARW